MILDYIDSNKCCGCSACSEICPQKAIKMDFDKDLFLYPQINFDKCINCNVCDQVCPIYNAEKTKNTTLKVYASYLKKYDVLKKSSSGGIFSAIAEHIIQNGGVVYGAHLDNNLTLKHIRIETCNDIKLLRGSKYFQSSLNNVYSSIKMDLNNNRLVYFVGTGCQVSAIKLYLRKPYENFITSDLICHGVPSTLLFNTFIKFYESKYNRKIISYNFRDKNVGGWSCSQSVKYQKGNKIKYDKYNPYLTGYMNAFMSADFFRESCYTCPFAEEKRSGDITLGDFWGVEKYHKMNTSNGVSAILINTAKGESIINKIATKIHKEETKIDYIKALNHNLYKPSDRPQLRNIQYKKLHDDGISVIMSYTNKSINQYVKFWSKYILIKTHIYSLYKSIIKND